MADMSDNLVKRLRKFEHDGNYPEDGLLDKAADEIERLQGTALYRAFKGMRRDRDECLQRAEAAEAREAKYREALDKLERWSRTFIEDTPLSAETIWREFPKAVEQARQVLQDKSDG